MLYYFITIDKCQLDVLPTKNDYFKFIFNLTDTAFCKSENIQCFEYKRKSKKFPRWLHYHGIFSSRYRLIFKNIPRQKGYSIDIIRIKNISELTNFVRYIQKEKTDIVDYTYQEYINSKEEQANNLKDLLDEIDQPN